MKALLQIGDKIHIREDINQHDDYHMKTTSNSNCYLPNKMCEPGKLVTIMSINKFGYKLVEEDFYTYTDEMFDPDVIEFLYEEYLINEKELYDEFVEYQNK